MISRSVLELFEAAFHFQQGGPEDRHDPYSSSNVKSTNVHIKQQMEFAISQQDYVSVFRWILIRSLVNKQYNLLADCWRLLHSTAYQIEYIMELNKSMQDLIISDLETTGTLAAAQERKRHPPPPDPNKPKKANQEEPPPPPPPEERGPLKLSILGRMMNSYRQKMDQILRMGCTYAPRCLPSLIQNKLKQLSEKDQETNEIFLVVDYGSVPVLQEINEMLEPLLHSTAYDMFLACPDIQNMVKEIKAEVCERVTLESSRKEFTIRASQIPELDSAEPLDF